MHLHRSTFRQIFFRSSQVCTPLPLACAINSRGPSILLRMGDERLGNALMSCLALYYQRITDPLTIITVCTGGGRKNREIAEKREKISLSNSRSLYTSTHFARVYEDETCVTKYFFMYKFFWVMIKFIFLLFQVSQSNFISDWKNIVLTTGCVSLKEIIIIIYISETFSFSYTCTCHKSWFRVVRLAAVP